MRAYKNSKLANVWFAKELQRRVEGSSVTANAVCPGFVPETIAEQAHGLQRILMNTSCRTCPWPTPSTRPPTPS